MPPIEWPIRMVRTHGSTVGEGVQLATSRSMTLFWSLRVLVGLVGEIGGWSLGSSERLLATNCRMKLGLYNADVFPA